MTIPRRQRLSHVRILPQMAVQIKKATLRGTLTPQIPFQGNPLHSEAKNYVPIIFKHAWSSKMLQLWICKYTESFLVRYRNTIETYNEQV
jgi:hypothetical protein